MTLVAVGIGIVVVGLCVLAWRWDVDVRLYRAAQGRTGERAAVARELSRQIDNGRAGGQGFIP
ncbi:hypothetical protein AB1207_10095 [Kineococcus endophyticus]|uniref:Uncharacterized protein n=1 Tax=Kineococcus endophyticus TaxID=1181883 RepID=A0ABV3P640_9ACTN